MTGRDDILTCVKSVEARVVILKCSIRSSLSYQVQIMALGVLRVENLEENIVADSFFLIVIVLRSSPFAATTEELFPPCRPHFWIDLLIQP